MRPGSRIILIGSGALVLALAIAIMRSRREAEHFADLAKPLSRLPNEDHWSGAIDQRTRKVVIPAAVGKIPDLPNEIFKNGSLNHEVVERARNLNLPEFEAFLGKIEEQVKDERVFAEVLWLILETKTPKWKHRLPEAQTVSLADQVRICNKFVPGVYNAMIQCYIREQYQESDDMETYRREALETMPPSAARATGYKEYFCGECKEVSSLKAILNSGQLEKIDTDAGKNGGGQSNYEGALSGFNSAFASMILENGTDPDEIIEIIKTSRIKESSKDSLIRTARKWGERQRRK